MKNTVIRFTDAYRVEITEEEVQLDALGSDEVLIESLYSVISAGTELACLSGREFWFQFPRVPGYASVGTIVAVGDRVGKFGLGDVVLNYGGHQKVNRKSETEFLLKVPDGMDLRLVPFTRMATVAFTAIRVSDIELGDDVAVAGLGLVGNFAAQLAGLQGGRVTGVDLVDSRIELARSCGVELAVNPSREDATARFQELTGGAGVHSLIDATGNSKAIISSLPWIGKLGELILLGTPRGEVQGDVTDMLSYVHLWPRGCVTLKGAHEWRYPVLHDPFVKHSLERNTRVVWRLQQEGKLAMDKLITHVVRPEDAGIVYKGLRTENDKYIGVVFDWT